MERLWFFPHQRCVGPCVDMMLNNGGVKSGHLRIQPGKNMAKLLEECFVSCDLLNRAESHKYFIGNTYPV